MKKQYRYYASCVSCGATISKHSLFCVDCKPALPQDFVGTTAYRYLLSPELRAKVEELEARRKCTD